MLPSLAGQSVPPEPDWFRLCVLVSDQLPPDAYAALSNVASRYNWLRIVPVSTKPAALGKCISESLDEFVDPQSCFASFRLDDDDALGRNYLRKLLSYTHEGHRGHVLTFPGGCKGWFDHTTQAYTRLADHWEPKIALGLAYVGHCQDKIRHVFQLGNHTRVDEKFPIISLPNTPMYLRSFHDDNDVLSVTETDKRAARVDRIFEKGQPMALKQLDEHFALG